MIIIATGSEVCWRCRAREQLEAEGTPTRVVSMPCVEWFDAQPPAYRQQVLPPDIKARVSVEAGVSQGWREIVGDAGEIISIEHFGASAEGSVLFEQFGFTPDRGRRRGPLRTRTRRPDPRRDHRQLKEIRDE